MPGQNECPLAILNFGNLSFKVLDLTDNFMRMLHPVHRLGLLSGDFVCEDADAHQHGEAQDESSCKPSA